MSFGFPYISMIEGCIHDGWLVIRTPEGLINKLYLRLLLLSDHARAAFAIAASGAVVQNLNADKVRQLAIPLPPLAEQHRIVAKVDELMVLCDQLEQQLNQADQQRRRLLEAVLAEALLGPEKTLEAAYA
jgi:type I restriction enzyme S subunit